MSAVLLFSLGIFGGCFNIWSTNLEVCQSAMDVKQSRKGEDYQLIRNPLTKLGCLDSREDKLLIRKQIESLFSF